MRTERGDGPSQELDGPIARRFFDTLEQLGKGRCRLHQLPDLLVLFFDVGGGSQLRDQMRDHLVARYPSSLEESHGMAFDPCRVGLRSLQSRAFLPEERRPIIRKDVVSASTSTAMD